MIVKAVTGSAGAVSAFALEFDDDPNGSTNAAATSASAAKGRRMRRAVKGVSFSEVMLQITQKRRALYQPGAV